ncbi:hypothetical protein ACK2FW_22795 [Clostridioides difficile]
MNEITAKHIRKWQNELLQSDYSQTYIKTINNQLVAILNYAVKYYNLPSNPAHLAGSIGKKMLMKCSFGLWRNLKNLWNLKINQNLV